MSGNERTIRNDAMRIGGEKVRTSDVVEVLYPYTDEVIGTVPAGSAEHAARAAAPLSRAAAAAKIMGERPPGMVPCL